MYTSIVSSAVIIGDSADDYLLVGKQGTPTQGKVYLSGLKKPITYKNIHGVAKSAFLIAQPGVFTFSFSAPAAGTKLGIKCIGPRPSRPETEETVFAQANVGEGESITLAAYAERVIAAINNNKAFAELFTATYAIVSTTCTVTLTQVIPGKGKIALTGASGIVSTLANGTVGRANRGMTFAQVQEMVNNAIVREYQLEVIGAYTSNSTFDVYAIEVANFTGMNPFSFKENAPEKILIIVSKTGNSTFVTALENLLALNSAFAPVIPATEALALPLSLIASDIVSTISLAATGQNTGDTITSNAHGLANDDRVFLTNPPAGLSAGVLYFVISTATNTFQVSLTSAGAAVAITADGTGIGVRKLATPVGDANPAELLCPTWLS
jgi:hypothetical protein